MNSNLEKTGVVVIGRNEEQHLLDSLRSVLEQSDAVVYVDSASSDASVAVALELGVKVVELSEPSCLNAGRARNAGMRWLLQHHPGMEMVQFLDGDCLLSPEWLRVAQTFLDGNRKVGAVCGRRRERHGRRSLYHRLCDIEWNTPVGTANAFGGDVMVRVCAFNQAGGFHSHLPGGEEPDLSLRMRQAGWKIQRLDADMSLHDVAISDFSAWWRRMMRSGYGAGWVVALWRARVADHEVPFLGLTRSARVWTEGWLAWGAGCVLLGVTLYGVRGLLWGSTLAAVVPVVQALRIAGHVRERAGLWDRLCYGAMMMIGKWAQRVGLAFQRRDQCSGHCARLMEYKGCRPDA